MASTPPPAVIKQEEQPVNLSSALYTISPSTPPSQEDWMPRTAWSYTQFTGLSSVMPPAFPYLRQVPLARSLRTPERNTPIEESDLSSPLQQPYAPSLQPYPFPTSLSPLSSRQQESFPRSHVPRPPNAFMLFRSDFLKRGIIPSHVERRQQNLSRIAGEVWNLMPADEKAKWHTQAAEVLLEHQTKNPDYKFTPAPRGSRRGKGKGRCESDHTGDDRIREIREKYAQMPGPAAAPTRRRRNRRRKVESDADAEGKLLSLSYSASAPCSPCSPPSSGSLTTNDDPQLPFFPPYTFPQVVVPRRPSTSLGFARSFPFPDADQNSNRAGLSLIRPSSVASSDTGLTTFLRDLDITPTVANFGSISMPTTPARSPCPSPGPSPYSLSSSSPDLCEGLRDAIPFHSLNANPFESPSLVSPFMAEQGDQSYSLNEHDAFLASIYSGTHYSFSPESTESAELLPFDREYLLPSVIEPGWDCASIFNEASNAEAINALQ